ncbi:protease B nonderepressible form [Lecanora helva]
MKQRTTFVHDSEDAFDPKQIRLDRDVVHIESLKAAREDRLTLGLYELPQEIWVVLKQCHELRVRWASSHSYAATAPFVSTVPPGLHVFFTPQKDRIVESLCPILQKIFGEAVACTSVEAAFTSPNVVSERFASSATYQYYNSLPSLQNFVIYIKEKLCARDALCESAAERLLYADYFDFDFDTISQSATLSAFWHKNPAAEVWTEDLDNRHGSIKLELGVLANQKPTQPEELSLGGFLAVVGEDTKPNPTLFSFPSRHHLADANFSTSFTQPTGLHPTLRLALPRSLTRPSSECALHAYITIPSFLFVDQYQLSSPNLLASKNLHSIRSLSGETDLEAPNWAVSRWGSTLLLQLAPPSTGESSSQEDIWHADIPLHLRYLQPSDTPKNHSGKPESSGGYKSLSVPWPNVFWACPTDEGTKMNTNPFDRVNLGYDGLFGPRTMFYHLRPAVYGKHLIETLTAPTLDPSSLGWIEIGTVVSVVIGFLWVLWKLVRVYVDDVSDSAEDRQKKEN